MDEWLGVLFIIGCFVMSFVMELKKKKKAMNGELSEPEDQDPDVITLEQAHRAPSPSTIIPQRNSATKNTVTKQATTRPNNQSEEAAEEASLEEIQNAVIWSEILNKKYT